MTYIPINSSFKKKLSQQILIKQVLSARHWIGYWEEDRQVQNKRWVQPTWENQTWPFSKVGLPKVFGVINVQEGSGKRLVSKQVCPPPWTSLVQVTTQGLKSPVFTSTPETPGLSKMQKSAHLAHSELKWTGHSLMQFSLTLQRMDPIHPLSSQALSTFSVLQMTVAPIHRENWGQSS